MAYLYISELASLLMDFSTSVAVTQISAMEPVEIAYGAETAVEKLVVPVMEPRDAMHAREVVAGVDCGRFDQLEGEK
ncbi:hypothetical protein NEOLI_005471 [Neolecta irregularis DAH-3]|uniref:Uncharacterized protein n=1 Tax=Neolecta irregularis (strain DAH-3) TaxID=1198029 RepID=A0A1U7LM39_NEOID|nr:hypothetical protein NEOLI_005471 [Neolecta irregularis DAH-3]|eukprot:OLL23717.1 hypothetical protein NEOLI_005471 [Neolecta irregularis DAH-3]